MDQIPETDKIDMAFLKSDKIGKVISKGLAKLYREQPQFPIEYLGKWLLNYCKTENNRGCMQQHLDHKTHLIQQGQKDEVEKQAELQKKEKEEQAKQNIETKFQESIKTELFHEKLLKKEFCNHLVKRGLTGVYVGYVDFPTKIIAENDDEENAHLETEQPKLIKFIGADDSHSFMVGQVLPLDQGVTGDVFKEVPPQDDPSIPLPSPVIYVPDVTKEPRMVYFKWKKLGAFLAIPLVYNSCLLSNSLDAGIEERQRFKRAVVEKNLEKETKIAEFNARIKEAQDAEQDATPIQEELDQFLGSWVDESEGQYQSQKRQFVVCFDTLGKDVEISQEDRKYFEDYVNLFGQNWQDMEGQLLSEDIDQMILKFEQGHPKEKAEQLTMQEEQAVDQGQGQFEELKEKEKEYNFSLLGIRATTLGQQIQANSQEFINLKQFRILKFPGILLGLLLFLGYKKSDLVVVDTNQLDWDGVKNYINEELIQKIVDYEYKGAKNEEIPKYSKLGRMNKRFSKFNVEQVEEYNTCYAKILKWIQLVIKLRQMDVEIRREKIANLRKLIQERQDEVQKMKDEKELKFEEEKQAKTQEEQEAMNKETWEVEYDELHPLPQIPDDVPDDIDNDYDDE